MVEFPPEIWIQIVGFACTDDGSTGRALSLVSKDLHEITRPMKLQSIAVVGAKQIIRFSAALTKVPATERCVRHLFVASPNPQLSTPSHRNITFELATAMRALTLNDAEDHPHSRVAIDEETISKAFYMILRILSATLVTLHAHFTFITRPSILVPVPLPSLTDLTLYGPFRSSPLSGSGSFPSIRRLHLGHFLAQADNVFSGISSAAPALTHLYIPQRAVNLRHLRIVLGLVTSVSSHPPQLPSTLENLFIEIDPIPPDRTSSEIRARESLMRNLAEIMQQDRRIFTVEGRPGWIDIPMAERDWLQRIAGQEGRWKSHTHW